MTEQNYPGWTCNVCGHFNPAFEHICMNCKPNNFHTESPQYGRVTDKWREEFNNWLNKQNNKN